LGSSQKKLGREELEEGLTQQMRLQRKVQEWEWFWSERVQLQPKDLKLQQAQKEPEQVVQHLGPMRQQRVEQQLEPMEQERVKQHLGPMRQEQEERHLELLRPELQAVHQVWRIEQAQLHSQSAGLRWIQR
jgi:hypothetical protein